MIPMISRRSRILIKRDDLHETCALHDYEHQRYETPPCASKRRVGCALGVVSFSNRL